MNIECIIYRIMSSKMLIKNSLTIKERRVSILAQFKWSCREGLREDV